MLSIVTGSLMWPGEWLFRQGQHGKPLFSSPEGHHDVSLSYSSGAVAVAVGKDCKIGVDIEALIEGAVPWPMLSDQERRAVCEHGSSQTYEQFLRLWTAKEASGKCRGVGIGALDGKDAAESDMTIRSQQVLLGRTPLLIAVAIATDRSP